MDKLGDLLDQPRLVDLVRDLGNYHRIALGRAASDTVDRRPRPHLNDAATFAIRAVDLFPAINETGGREIGAWYELDQLIDAGFRSLYESDGRVNYFGQVVRWDLRRHTDRDALRTVDEQVRKTGRHH